MKKIFQISLCVVFSLVFFACSNDVNDSTIPNGNNSADTFLNQKEAFEIAKKFINAQELLGPETKSTQFGLDMVYTDLSNEPKTKADAKPAYYIFNIDKAGYVIVSAEKTTYPILGYSSESSFNPNTIPYSMVKVLGNYKKEINLARQQGLTVTEEIKNERKMLLDEGAVRTKAGRSVAPLLGSIKWDQAPYYNYYCPSGAPVGCVATAASQIMRHYKYPKSGEGTYKYYSKLAGEYLSFDYNYEIDWDAMPEHKLYTNNLEVAKFCYGVAVGVRMNFTPRESLSYHEDLVKLLQRNYKYPQTVRLIYRGYYSTKRWNKIIREELQAGRPVQYGGIGNYGGHSFVCDGYDSNTKYYHINWGWGGMSDGYFLLEALDPRNLGTGSGGGGYNSYQQAVIGFAPPANRGDDNNNNNGGNDNNADDNNDDNADNNNDNNGGDDNNADDNNDNSNDDNNNVSSSYCQPIIKTSYYTYIKGLTFGDMSDKSRSYIGYADNTSSYSKKIYATAGTKLYVKLTPGFARGSYEMYWKGWIDYNKNKRFDSNEEIISFSSKKSGSGKIKIKNVRSGKYRLRVAVKYGSYPKACEDFKYGQVKDYTIQIR